MRDYTVVLFEGRHRGQSLGGRHEIFAAGLPPIYPESCFPPGASHATIHIHGRIKQKTSAATQGALDY